MKCPFCQSPDNKVVDKRESEDLATTRRRRECLKCKKRFTTFEKVEDIGLIIFKKDGRREKFNREKLIIGITKACEKRPVSPEKIEKVVDEIEAELRLKETKEIPSKIVGETVIKKIRSLDKVAYIRFASVYREFEDLETFEEELKKLIRKRR